VVPDKLDIKLATFPVQSAKFDAVKSFCSKNSLKLVFTSNRVRVVVEALRVLNDVEKENPDDGKQPKTFVLNFFNFTILNFFDFLALYIRYIEKIKKQDHKLDRIRVERIRTFPLLLILFMAQLLMIQWKLDCGSCKQKQRNQLIRRSRIELCDWFILWLMLPTLTI